MLKRYLVTDHAALDRILAWVAVADNRSQLIGSRVADTVEYHVVVDLTHGHDHLIELITTEFAHSISAAEFPRRH
jgi:ABC-type uncharacterized transport system permease subunit